jgi:hypothetical protein
MLTSEIPTRLTVKAPPFTGVYERRKMKSQNLYCWFNTEDDVIFPHISVEISPEHNIWRDFHISFPILQRGGWDESPTKVSFSIYYRINGGTIDLVKITNTLNIKRVDKGGMDFTTMKDESKLLALRFVRAAMIGAALN